MQKPRILSTEQGILLQCRVSSVENDRCRSFDLELAGGEHVDPSEWPARALLNREKSALQFLWRRRDNDFDLARMGCFVGRDAHAPHWQRVNNLERRRPA